MGETKFLVALSDEVGEPELYDQDHVPAGMIYARIFFEGDTPLLIERNRTVSQEDSLEVLEEFIAKGAVVLLSYDYQSLSMPFEEQFVYAVTLFEEESVSKEKNS